MFNNFRICWPNILQDVYSKSNETLHDGRTRAKSELMIQNPSIKFDNYAFHKSNALKIIVPSPILYK